MKVQLQPGDALLIVDAQNDFFPGGSLGVPDGDQIIPIVNELIKNAKQNNIPIIASRDWHPAHHVSFKENGGIWPTHCVQETPGAQFHPDVTIPDSALIVNKAFQVDHEAYSAFEGETLDGKSLTKLLQGIGIKRVWVVGLALDYCVRASVLDGVSEGFQVNVILDATRIIDADRQNEVVDEIQQAGGKIV